MMHKPMHPGAYLKEAYLTPADITITDAAKRLNVTRKALSELVNTKSNVSIEMAFRLATACDTTPEFWLQMQMNYDLSQSKNLIDTSTIHSLSA